MRGNASSGRTRSAPRSLHLGDPQTVQVAVLVDLDRAVALGDSEVGFRLVGARQLRDLVALLGNQADKRNEVLVGHRMGHAADLDVNGIARNAHDGDVLLNRRISGIRDQLGHLLAAAGKRGLLVEGLHGNVAAVVAFIERDVHNVSLSRLRPARPHPESAWLLQTRLLSCHSLALLHMLLALFQFWKSLLRLLRNKRIKQHANAYRNKRSREHLPHRKPAAP